MGRTCYNKRYNAFSFIGIFLIVEKHMETCAFLYILLERIGIGKKDIPSFFLCIVYGLSGAWTPLRRIINGNYLITVVYGTKFETIGVIFLRGKKYFLLKINIWPYLHLIVSFIVFHSPNKGLSHRVADYKNC